MKYTQNDLDYVLTYARLRGRAPSTPEEVAQLAADVRQATIAACIYVCDGVTGDAWEVGRRLRALLDEGKAEPRCVYCGAPRGDISSCRGQQGTAAAHDFWDGHG